jgi:hypothetical protein
MVGVTGFEPTTPAPPAQCSTRLSYTPTDAPHSRRGQRGADYNHRDPLGQQKAAAAHEEPG